jgi:predicted dehydrogenase
VTEGRKLRVGIVGMSSDHVWWMGDGLAALPEVELVAAAEAYPELRQQGLERWKLQHTYPDMELMFATEQLDAILICGDNLSKATIVEAAARRKIHVYSDKPMGATFAQAQASWKAAHDAGITYMVAYHSVFSPVYEHNKQLLQAGAIGKPYLARGVVGHGGPIEYGCTQYFTEWLFDNKRNGGGSFVDEGCYLLDEFVDVFGNVAEVSAFTTQMGHRDYLPQDVEDNSVAILRFANGALGVVDSKWGQVGPAPIRASYHGDRGTLIVRDQAGPSSIELYSTVSPAPVVPGNWEPIDLSTAAPGSHPNAPGLRAWSGPGAGGRSDAEARTFVAHALANEPIQGAAGPATALHVQEIIDAAYVSARTGRAVKLPLEQ